MSQPIDEDDILTPILRQADEPAEEAAVDLENVKTPENNNTSKKTEETITPIGAQVTFTKSPPPIQKKTPKTTESNIEVIRKGVRQLDFSDHKVNKRKKKRKINTGCDESPEEIKKRILDLQANRFEGIWVECCHEKCKKWRFLSDTTDMTQLPETWYCSMNSDLQHNSCSDEEVPRTVDEEVAEFVDSPYTLGSVVWAELMGYPPWPAMIDDDPDIDQFYWLEGRSDIPTWYHVIFFDDKIQRAWIKSQFVNPLSVSQTYRSMGKMKIGGKDYEAGIKKAFAKAIHALSLSTQERLSKYCFVNCFKDWKSCKRKKVEHIQPKAKKPPMSDKTVRQDPPELGCCMPTDNLNESIDSLISDPENLLSEAEAFFRSQDQLSSSSSDSELEEYKTKSKGSTKRFNKRNGSLKPKSKKQIIPTVKKINNSSTCKKPKDSNSGKNTDGLALLSKPKNQIKLSKQTKLPVYRVKKPNNVPSKKSQESEISESVGPAVDNPSDDMNSSIKINETVNGAVKKRKFFAPCKGSLPTKKNKQLAPNRKLFQKPNELKSSNTTSGKIVNGNSDNSDTGKEEDIKNTEPSDPFMTLSDYELTELLEAPMSPQY